MNFQRMPHLCMWNIYHNLPLTDLLTTVQLISSQFYNQHKTALKQRHNLTILIGPNAAHLWKQNQFTVPHYELLSLTSDQRKQISPLSISNQALLQRQVLRLTKLDKNVVEIITKIMPNIKSLEIVIGEQDYFNDMVLLVLEHLLLGWSSQLRSFKLICKPDLSSVQIQSLFDTINRTQSVLDRLMLNVFGHFAERLDPDGHSFDIPALARLREFHFFSTFCANQICDSLKCYAEGNPKLRRLGLGDVSFMDKEFLKIFANSPLLDKIYCSNLAFFNSTPIETLTARSYSFRSSIILHCRLNTDIVRVGIALQPLTSLVVLHLEESVFRKRQAYPLEKLTNCSLPSIKSLVLTFMLNFHGELSQFEHWHRLFPSLETVTIDNRGYKGPCLLCRKWWSNECARQLIAPFREQCGNIKQINLYLFMGPNEHFVEITHSNIP